MSEEVFEDRPVICRDCGEEFIFAAGEQRYYRDRELAFPKRCPSCREKRKVQGTYGAQVVAVDAKRGVVLCKRCRHPASREVSFEAGEALCRACSENVPGTADTSEGDRMAYGVWEAWLKLREKANGLRP
jgi:Zn finger protein HypA/HybF involved in hydrogenase expression